MGRWGALAVAGVLAAPAAPGAEDGLGCLVPAYFHPASSAGAWESLAAAAGRVPLVAIVNPNSGPGSAADPAYTGAVASVRAAGGRVVGYVHTSYGARSLAEVKDEVMRYQAFYALDGYFVDEMPNRASAGVLGYYQDLRRFILERNADHVVIGNPGTNTDEAFLREGTADALVVFERNDGYDSFAPAPWVTGHHPCRFGHLPYNIPAGTDLAQFCRDASARHAGLLYVTDDAGANPWDRLPGYWSEWVEALEAWNRRVAERAPPRLSGTLSGAAPRLEVRGTIGRQVAEISTDLGTWAPWRTNLAACGAWSFEGADLGTQARFYRVRQ